MKTYVNLLSPRHQRTALIRTLLTRWCAVWVVGITLLAGVFWLNKGRYERIAASLSAAELACMPVIATAKENDRMLSQMRRFACRETLVGQLRDDKPVLGLLAIVSRSARVCNQRIVVRDLHFEQQSTNRKAAATKNAQVSAENPEPVDPWAALTIQGDALDNLAIAKFTATLRDTGLFREVELKSSVGKTVADRPVHSFVVRCEI